MSQDLKEQIKEDERYKELTLGKNIICNDHEFLYIKGSEAKCKKCPLGFFLGPENSIKAGKIYLHGEKLLL